MNDLLVAHRHTTNNRTEIEASTLCGCCYCMRTFASSEIVAWSGLDIDDLHNPEAPNAETANCPKCGGEAVIGDKSGYEINVQFLGRMNEAWFHQTIVRKPSAKK